MNVITDLKNYIPSYNVILEELLNSKSKLKIKIKKIKKFKNKKIEKSHFHALFPCFYYFPPSYY